MSARDVIADLRALAARTSDANGAQRVAWSPVWRDARRWLDERLADAGLRAETDAAGNNWITLPGARPDTVVIGGHLDSVPNGGWLDGPLGVLAGVEALRRRKGTTPPGDPGGRGLRRRGRRAFLAQPAGVVGGQRQPRARQRARPRRSPGRAARRRAGRERRGPGPHARGPPRARPAAAAGLPRAPHRAGAGARGDGPIDRRGGRHLRGRAPRPALRRPGRALRVDADCDAPRRVPGRRRNRARLSRDCPAPLDARRRHGVHRRHGDGGAGDRDRGAGRVRDRARPARPRAGTSCRARWPTRATPRRAPPRPTA